MDTATIFGLALGIIWGIVWALFLQRTYAGRFMAARLTWLSVVIGIGVDLIIAFFVVPFEAWIRIAAIITLSSIGIIVRSLLNDSSDHRALIERKHGDQNTSAE